MKNLSPSPFPTRGGEPEGAAGSAPTPDPDEIAGRAPTGVGAVGSVPTHEEATGRQDGGDTSASTSGLLAAGMANTAPMAEATARWGARPLRGGRRLAIGLLPALGLLAALILLWQWYASQPFIDQQFLPTPLAVWNVLVSQRDILWYHTQVTLYETLVGFAAALAAGLICGTLIDFSPWLRRAPYPLLVTSQTIPIITLAPLLVLWFGFGIVSKSIVVLLVCFFPIVVALADGLRSADPELIKLYRAFGAGPIRIFWSVRLPGALPSLFSGIRIAITYSVIGAIFGEYVAASAGLGFYIELKQHAFATAGVIAAIVVTAALSIFLFTATALIERVALPWYYAQGRSGGV